MTKHILGVTVLVVVKIPELKRPEGRFFSVFLSLNERLHGMEVMRWDATEMEMVACKMLID